MITAVLPIREASQVADARRRAVDRAHSLSLRELPTGQLSIIVTELATNLVKFARDGVLLLDTYEDADGEGIQVLSLDKGPGMSSVARCLEDGFSTAGSAGTGLGAVRRLANSFAIDSWPSGTAVMARVGTRKTAPPMFPTWGRADEVKLTRRIRRVSCSTDVTVTLRRRASWRMRSIRCRSIRAVLCMLAIARSRPAVPDRPAARPRSSSRLWPPGDIDDGRCGQPLDAPLFIRSSLASVKVSSARPKPPSTTSSTSTIV